MSVYFCQPGSLWQRDSNENINGLLGQYLPKRTNIGAYGAQHFAQIAAELSTRPCRCLDWSTPPRQLAKLFTTVG